MPDNDWAYLNSNVSKKSLPGSNVSKKGVPGLQRENSEDEHHCLCHQLASLQLNSWNPVEDGDLAIKNIFHPPDCSFSF